MEYRKRRKTKGILAGLFLLGLGSVLVLENFYPNIDIHGYIWPGVLIFVGLVIILRPKRYTWSGEWREEWQRHRKSDGRPRQRGGDGPTEKGAFDMEDFIDSTFAFGTAHRKSVSKNFKGGDIVTIMGGTVIDLTEADIKGNVRLDVTQVMGGTKILVPMNWEVRSDVSAIFAGFEDKRERPAIVNPEKVLFIDGTSIFGAIEVRTL
jgi:predicted membrane protein